MGIGGGVFVKEEMIVAARIIEALLYLPLEEA
jgi:hypothetical protein